MSVNRLIVVLLMLTLPLASYSQAHLWVFFSDKGEAAAGDLTAPVEGGYLQSLQEQGWQVISHSRWLNAAVIKAEGVDPAQINSLPYVTEIRPVARFQRLEVEPSRSTSLSQEGDPSTFGRAEFQNQMIGVGHLHQQGYQGQGVVVAVLDAGFEGVDAIPAFAKLRREGRILATRDFVDGDDQVYGHHDHGTEVLSTIAADLPEQLVGSAPQVSVLLARTEDASSETQIEEHNFVAALEWADSLGADLVHASLGYSRFWQNKGSYSHDDLDGNTAITTRAVDIAAGRGMLITVAAGNEGSGTWRKITVPCDADSVLCIGSVDRQKRRSSFSSVGPTADDRIKPDVVAFGSGAAVAQANHRLGTGRGTSLSSPIVAGMAACLRQAHPSLHSQQIIEAIKQSGDRSTNPDSEYGYGIPDARLADSLLSQWQNQQPVAIQVTDLGSLSAPSSMEEAFRNNCQSSDAAPVSIQQKGKKLLLSAEHPADWEAKIALYSQDQLLAFPFLPSRVKKDRLIWKMGKMEAQAYELLLLTTDGNFLFPFNLE